MQTFLPYESFVKSAKILDTRRLVKQITEGYQILKALSNNKSSWGNHPAVLMWKGYEGSLCEYIKTFYLEYLKRFPNSEKFYNVINYINNYKVLYKKPYWLGDTKFHTSHKSNLLRKDREYYNKYFKNIPDDLDYIWPTYYIYWDKPYRQLTDDGMKSLIASRKLKKK